MLARMSSSSSTTSTGARPAPAVPVVAVITGGACAAVTGATGVAARGSYGHTPGHMAFELRDGSESLMVLGDSLGNHHVAFEAPDFISGSDQDGATAATTRLSLLDQITSAQMRVAGFHLPGGFGRVERAGSAFRFRGAGLLQ